MHTQFTSSVLLMESHKYVNYVATNYFSRENIYYPKSPLMVPVGNPFTICSLSLLSCPFLECYMHGILDTIRPVFLTPATWHKVWESLMHCKLVASFSLLLFLPCVHAS